MQEKILKIIEDTIAKKVTVDDSLLESGLLDSISAVDLILAIGEEFSVEIPITNANEILVNVKSLVAYVEQNS